MLKLCLVSITPDFDGEKDFETLIQQILHDPDLKVNESSALTTSYIHQFYTESFFLFHAIIL